METMKFEDYLKAMCFKINPQVLDDDMPDFFNNWLAEQDGNDLIQYAEEAMAELQNTLEAQRITQHND